MVDSTAVTSSDVEKVLDEAGVSNPHVREYVTYWAGITGPARVEVVNASDDARLVAESLEAGELQPAGEGLYYSRSYFKDTARSEERTIVATYAAGVELTDNRPVVLHMIRMARVGVSYLDQLEDPAHFVRAVHVTGDLENLGQGTPEDQRYFVTVADQRTILHFGSSYGGNALLGKIAHGLRQACYDGRASGRFLAEQFMLLGISDLETGKRWHIAGGFPSASGKTNLAMTLAPDALGSRYRVDFYGDDIAWLWVGDDGRVYAMNPEFGVFGVAKDTNEATNPTALDSIQPGSGAIFTNVAYNELTQEVWWEGKTKNPPADLDGWLDWKGERIADRENGDDSPWAHPNSRFTTTLANVPNVAADFEAPQGVPVDAIIFGGRTRDREPLVRAITDLAEGVYDGLTLGAEATFAADGLDGQLRYDPMSMRPFMAYGEGDYAAHWLEVIGKASQPPIFAHVNWFQRDAEDGHFLWPGYRENLRPLLWLMQFKEGEVEGVKTPVGVIPAESELVMDGLEVPAEDMSRILTLDTERWRQEMGFREEHLAQFERLPEEIWEAHRRVAADLG